ncbi:MAG: DNA-processing protein DprA [Agathobaculum sp.]|uniref:DNA-processing protein DprA n=1 Tax=Agathobaculum sp. TaxID=2048138 RepID=UPI0025BB1C1E|nr:DNA-processing protein DprA [Agathobaculum sp.]MCI7125537.1 DNA-processing protein DprA [Agathobaculum sp.]MDY3712681.1 DNA-processing protein DprA [Agathobaculum sp.]
MSAQLSYVWLSRRRGIGAGLLCELLRVFGSPDAVYAADRRTLEAACPLRRAQADSLCDKSTDEAEEILRRCAAGDIRILTLGDSAYPDRLRAIADPPVVLYVRGRWPDFDVTPAVAVVGTRDATQYGRTTAEKLGAALARAGFITVSGMARGNDGAAHRGALRAGGLTVAVLAGGADVCYPPEHRSLMGDILLSGAVVSEYPPGSEPRGAHYHNRNRIISGLSVATVIVEATDWRSGALITVRHALDQGRDVYAVPGTLDAPRSAACNALIERGEAALLSSPAALVRAYSGLLRGANTQVRPAPPRQDRHRQGEARRPKAADTPVLRTQASAPAGDALPQSLGDDERAIVELVRQGVSGADELVARCGLPAARVMSLVTMLEMDGILRREKGKLVLFRR